MNKKIKFNKFFLYKLIMLICINIVLTQCNMKRNIDHNNDVSSTIDNFENIDIYENELYDEQNQLKKQELQINNIVYYPLDKYDILPEFFYMLDTHANFLCNNPLYHIKIEGHADERGTPEYNIALGERRANSVKLYLQSRGVLSKQILVISYGKEKPAVLGHNEEAYSKNRRAVLIYQ